MTEEKKLEPELRFPGFHEPWEEKKLGDVLEVRPNKFNPKTDDKFSYSIELENIEQNSGRLLGLSKINKKSSTKNIFDEHNILFSKLRPYLKKFFKPTKVGVCSSEIWVFNVKNNENLDYIYNLIQTNRFISIANITTGTRMPRADWSYMRGKKFSFPSLQEQEKIGKFFYAIDKKLNLQREKIEELKSYKKGMMQRIFDQEIRFKDEDGRDYPDWEEKKLGEVLIEVNQRNKSLDLEVITSTIDGLYFQSEYFKNRVASKNTKKYKILKKNQIVLSPQNIWMGNINYNDKIKIGIVSPSYKVFETTSEIVGGFVKYFIKTPRMLYNYMISSEQGASVVRRNLNINLFKKINIKLPSLPEQEKIANFLSAIDRWIELEEEKLELYEEFKKGLMQRMFV